MSQDNFVMVPLGVAEDVRLPAVRYAAHGPARSAEAGPSVEMNHGTVALRICDTSGRSEPDNFGLLASETLLNIWRDRHEPAPSRC